MDISPLQHHGGVDPASALEGLAHRLVVVHPKKVSDAIGGRVVKDVVDIPIFSESEFGLDAPGQVSGPGFLDRIRRFFSS